MFLDAAELVLHVTDNITVLPRIEIECCSFLPHHSETTATFEA